jgi:hypothetical protein
MRCQMQNPGVDTHSPAVAVVTFMPSGNRAVICKQDLDWFLDSVDDGENDEPARVAFLLP